MLPYLVFAQLTFAFAAARHACANAMTDFWRLRQILHQFVQCCLADARRTFTIARLHQPEPEPTCNIRSEAAQGTCRTVFMIRQNDIETIIFICFLTLYLSLHLCRTLGGGARIPVSHRGTCGDAFPDLDTSAPATSLPFQGACVMDLASVAVSCSVVWTSAWSVAASSTRWTCVLSPEPWMVTTSKLVVGETWFGG